MSAARAEANAPEPTMGSYEDLTYKVLPREYGDSAIELVRQYLDDKNVEEEEKSYILKQLTDRKDESRNIVIQTIPKGTLLYHYYCHDILDKDESRYRAYNNSPVPSWNDLTNEQKASKEDNFYKSERIRYYSRFAFQDIKYNPTDDTVTFCLSKSLVNPTYYFSVPYAVYGLYQGMHREYNTMIPVVLKEDIRVAYLSSGADISDTSTTHRLYPNPYFNFQRVTSCNKTGILQQNGNVCGEGSSGDACLRKMFAAEESLDGISAIAENDAMLIYDNETNKYEPASGNLYGKMIEYKNYIHHKTEYEINIYTTILLALKQDRRIRTKVDVKGDPYFKDIIGFMEYALHPFGKKGYKGEHFLPPPANDLYTIIEHIEGEKQIIKTSFSNFERVYKQFIEPNLIVSPLCILDSKMAILDTMIFPESIMAPEHKNFWIYRQLPEQNISNPKIGSLYYTQVNHKLFFDWLLKTNHALIYNPLVNTFQIYKDGYPHSAINLQYRNEFEENPDLPGKEFAKRDYTNIKRSHFDRNLTYIKPDGTYGLNTSEIQCALELKYLKCALQKDYSRKNEVYLYRPISNPSYMPPVFVGPMREIDLYHLRRIVINLTKDVPFSFGLRLDGNFLNYIETLINENKLTYLGRIVPPSANNLQNQAVLNNTNLSKTNTTLFNGGGKKRRLHRRNYKTYKRILKKGRGKAKRGTRRTK